VFLKKENDRKKDPVSALFRIHSLIPLSHVQNRAPPITPITSAASPRAAFYWNTSIRLKGFQRVLQRAWLCRSPVFLHLEDLPCDVRPGTRNSYVYPRRIPSIGWGHSRLVRGFRPCVLTKSSTVTAPRSRPTKSASNCAAAPLSVRRPKCPNLGEVKNGSVWWNVVSA
jgi:hypothetical protein